MHVSVIVIIVVVVVVVVVIVIVYIIKKCSERPRRKELRKIRAKPLPKTASPSRPASKVSGVVKV